MKNRFLYIILLICFSPGFFSCKKTYKEPPTHQPAIGHRVTIAALRAAVKEQQKITHDSTMYLTITMDETSGNIFKTVYAKDSTGAIAISLRSSGGLYQGDYIRLNLKNTTIDYNSGTLQIDSVIVDSAVTKLSTGNPVTPLSLSISSLFAANISTLESQLVTLTNVEFLPSDTGKLYAGPSTSQNGTHYLIDASTGQLTVPQTLTENFNTVVNKQNVQLPKPLTVYTSGYANFAHANYPIAGKSGSITGVITQYNGTLQFTLRSYNDINLNFPYVNANVWTNVALNGPYLWQGTTSSPGSPANPCVSISGPFSSACNCNTSSDDGWLITPMLNNPTGRKLDFKNTTKYNNSYVQLFVYAATNFDGVHVASANWKQVHCEPLIVATSGTPSFFNAQNIVLDTLSNLKNYTGNYHIAFRFRSDMGDSTATYFLDDVIVH